MDIREKYELLVNTDVSNRSYEEMNQLKDECKLLNNNEYYYLTILLIIDTYIANNQLNDALNLAVKSFDNLDSVYFPKIYVLFLDRIIYIFYHKKNYKSAYRYANQMKMFLDPNDNEEINRWYLNTAYIYNGLKEKNQSLNYFIAVLENNPDDELKLIVLNNITSLFIESNNANVAKNYLSLSMDLAIKLNDEESKTYCQYLNAKLYILEGKKNFAEKIFYEIFKGVKELNIEYIGYLNDFLNLLNDLNDYKETKKLAEKYLSSVEANGDLYAKKEFYKNYLLALFFLVPNLDASTKNLYRYLEELNQEIASNEEQISLESYEDDKDFQLNLKLKEISNKVEKITSVVNYAGVSSNERECIFEFSKRLNEIVPFDEVTFIVFDRANFNAYPQFIDQHQKVFTFNYKKERLYERTIEYNSLNGSIVETLIKSQNEVIIDFEDTNIPIIELFTHKSYQELNVKSLYALPLIYNKNMYACCIYTSANSITDYESTVALSIANHLFEAKLVNLFYQEGLKNQKLILESALSNLNIGLYYQDIKKNYLELNKEMANFVNIDKEICEEEDFLEFVKDKEKYLEKKKKMESLNKYKIEYTISCNDNDVLVEEIGYPYFDKDNNPLFYVCIVNKAISNQTLFNREKQKYYYVLDEKALNKEMLNKKEFTLICFELTNNNEFQKLYNECLMVTNDLYQIDSNKYAVIFDDTQNRNINSFVKKVLKNLNKAKVSIISYPNNYNDINNIIKLSKFVLENNTNSINKLNEEDLQKYNKGQNLDECIKEECQNKSLEILYYPLMKNDKVNGYWVGYNLKGNYNSDIYNDLFKDSLIDLETYLLENVSLGEEKVYLKMSWETIKILLDKNIINEKMSNKLVLCLNDYSVDNEVLNRLANIDIFINGEIIDQYSIKDLQRENVKGVFFMNNYDNVDLVKKLSIKKLLILSNKLVTDDCLLCSSNPIKK